MRASRRPGPAFPCQGLGPPRQTWNRGLHRPWLRLTTGPGRTIARSCKKCPTCCRDALRWPRSRRTAGCFATRDRIWRLLCYDNLTAVYDISAHAVYLPNGLSLEAHSGIGSLKDDPEHANVPNTGATPPAAYELKPRERLFHGVQALRMIPAEGSTTNGRSGLLAHSYMLGPNGDSNGCVSIRDYDRFLKAFNDGEINRLVVVPSLSGATLAAQHSNTQS